MINKKSFLGFLLALNPFVFFEKFKKSINFVIIFSDLAEFFRHGRHERNSEDLWVLFHVDFGLPGEQIDMTASESVAGAASRRCGHRNTKAPKRRTMERIRI